MTLESDKICLIKLNDDIRCINDFVIRLIPWNKDYLSFIKDNDLGYTIEDNGDDIEFLINYIIAGYVNDYNLYDWLMDNPNTPFFIERTTSYQIGIPEVSSEKPSEESDEYSFLF